MSRRSCFVVALVAFFAIGCKHIPSDSYGIARLRFHGVDELDDAALRACLATRQRGAFQVDLGTSSELECNVPPFDGGRVPIRFFSWPWTEWPTFDEAVFERDLDRIERWYRARGYYDARVERTRFDPDSATGSDELPPAGAAPCERNRGGDGCRLEIDVYVDEGEPVHVRHVEILGLDTLTEQRSTQRRIERSRELSEGDRFDEALHDRTKLQMITAMRESGYACANVQAEVNLDPDLRIADLRYQVMPGIVSHFREVRVEVQGDAHGIPLDVVRAVSGIEAGMLYAPSKIAIAQRDVYALGAFSAVEVEAVPVRPDGTEAETTNSCTGDVDVVISVTPGRRIRYGIGAGIDSGNVTYLAAGSTTQNVPQWNVHLVARFEHRNLFGGLRRLRIEDRPKIAFQRSFTGVDPATDPTPGNELSFEFRQPAFIERATTMTVAGRWDLGPDPIYGGLRHLVDLGTSVQRPFVSGHVTASVGVYGNAYLQIRPPEVVLADYWISFLRQYVQIDYRDDPHVTRRGFMVSLDVSEAGPARLATWSYIRVVPEVRAFIPLPARITIAGRFLMGLTHIYDRPGADFQSKDERSWLLGPSAYRLRGGGPNSHRGYTAGRLGDEGVDADGDGRPDFDPLDGGLAKWEASLEVRARITESFAAVFFADAGDVNRQMALRFNVPHIALGFGVRYYTIVGPLRLDFGFRPRGMQAFGDGVDLTGDHRLIGHSRVRGAISLTIGEAF